MLRALSFIVIIAIAAGCAPAVTPSPTPRLATPPVTIYPTRPVKAIPDSTQVPTSVPTTACHADPWLVVVPSVEEGWCELFGSLFHGPNYAMPFPRGWTVRLAGAEGINLMFNEESEALSALPLFVQMTGVSASLPLDQVDRATYGFEMSPEEPLVDSTETILEKRIATVGSREGRNVLFLVTRQGDHMIRRYFVKHDQTESKSPAGEVIMFESRFPTDKNDSPELMAFFGSVEEVVARMRFIVRW